ncbi:gag-pol polyprotein precursor [Lasius niger]|uniref:Gag-pol polyprotein n=1 Tax=Lasius niger TaxID=67767 RepID=A0A0J7KCX3_LASNI|nr:gag-pol polyprotein precursor [Lasius niger]
MTTLENYIARQDELYDLISRSVENLQNLGGAKLTRGHISSRLEALKNPASDVDTSTTSRTANHVAQPYLRLSQSVLLATAVVNVAARGGEPIQARALLDQGSEVSFISEPLAQLLKVRRRPASVPIVGIGAHQTNVARGATSIKIISRVDSSFSLVIDALILPKLTSYLPSSSPLKSDWHHIKDLNLADPSFASPGKIDLVLGASVYAQILQDEVRKDRPDAPIAQKTAFGWVLSGPIPCIMPNNLQHERVQGFQCSLDHELLELLQRFWSLEEVPNLSEQTLTPDELQCEDHFKNTFIRDGEGRFIVRLPIKRDLNDLGKSYTSSHRMLLRMEKRFTNDDSLRKAYIGFMNEYRELDHMRASTTRNQQPRHHFFLPHHGVLNKNSSTTKLRVVFNGSQTTDSGISLNECLHVGPKLQTDIADVLLRWRRHPFVFATDIVKMYRQIRVHPDDWPLQQILWREAQNEEPQAFSLCTVTYGLTCAPYLALRCLRHLALEGSTHFPEAAEILQHDTYVDDILSGAESIPKAKQTIQQLQQFLKQGGFPPEVSNSDEILTDIALDHHNSSATLQVSEQDCQRTLGILWNRNTDQFVFSIPPRLTATPLTTKRTVLSSIAQLFDPLGWLSPIVITAKLLMQELWAIRLDWDEELPSHLQTRWEEFIRSLPQVANISMPRWLGISPQMLGLEIHGFSDASQDAIAAVIYLRVINDLDLARVTLAVAKTKSLHTDRIPLHLWTDSTIALTWIKGHPSRWKDFVRNRVSFIQELSNSRWHHVSGKENPADLASRGISPQQLQDESLWWAGPKWLQHHSASWPSSSQTLSPDLDLEERANLCATASPSSEDKMWDLISRYSTLTRLLRITVWCRRATQRLKGNKQDNSIESPPRAIELKDALIFWTEATQRTHFSKEIKLLQNLTSLPTSSPLTRLCPFLDEHGRLRLQGRLRFASINPSEKQPLILPRESTLTHLLIRHHHHSTLHGGTQLTLSLLRRHFWILGGRVPVRAFIQRCMTCARHRASTSNQRMGQLPPSRVTPCRPFLNAGIDYAGPITLKTFRGRGAKTYKGYFIIFVCFSSSAVHLEVATDYTTDGFIAAYKRFTGRRGLCATITSDCGTNLVGADQELKRLFKASSREWHHIAHVLANDGVTWKFNPPSAPHFGGKWEAGVKSVKFHLRRVVGEAILTYEELQTLLVQIEVTLNSRPLCALSEDPSDLTALTPGHFLIGTAITSIPEPSLCDVPEGRLSRWQLLRKMTESFWTRWSTEYLHQLQVSNKWFKTQPILKLGTLVLVKDERLPPSKWALARVIDVHPGADGLIRVATVRTQTSTLKRPLVKLCVLPSPA